MAPPPYDNTSQFDVASWTDEEALRRYTQRRKDLEAMLRRFQFYVVGNRKAASPLSKEDIGKVARLVFCAAVGMNHLDFGSTSETSSPLFDILISDTALAHRKDTDMPLIFHAYAVQCEGDYTMAVYSKTAFRPKQHYSYVLLCNEVRRAKHIIENGEKLSRLIDECRPPSHHEFFDWMTMVRERRAALSDVPRLMSGILRRDDLFVFANGRFRISLSVFITRNDEEALTFPIGSVPDSSGCYWYAMDGREVKQDLGTLLPYATRLDNRRKVFDSEREIAPVLRWAIDHVEASWSDIDIVNRIRKLSKTTAGSWFWDESGSLVPSKGQFVMAFVSAQHCTLKKLSGRNSQDESVEIIIAEMERCLRLLAHYRNEPLSEPHDPKEAGSQEVEGLQKLKRQLIEHNEQLRKENAELERENKRLKATETKNA